MKRRPLPQKIPRCKLYPYLPSTSLRGVTHIPTRFFGFRCPCTGRRGVYGPAAVAPGRPSGVQTPRPAPDLLKPHLPLNRVPRWPLCRAQLGQRWLAGIRRLCPGSQGFLCPPSRVPCKTVSPDGTGDSWTFLISCAVAGRPSRVPRRHKHGRGRTPSCLPPYARRSSSSWPVRWLTTVGIC